MKRKDQFIWGGGDMKRFHVEVAFKMVARGWIDFLKSRNKSEDISGIEAKDIIFYCC